MRNKCWNFENGKRDHRNSNYIIDRFVTGKKVLDVGCGMGFYSEYLANKGFNVTAVDIEKQFVPKKSKFELANAENLPFEDESFNTVLLFDILEHGDDQKILKEAHRVCKKRIILSVPNKDDSFLPKYNLTFKYHKDKTHRREYTQEEIKKLLERFGFRTLRIASEGEISPFVFASFLRPPLSYVCLGLIFILKKLKLFKPLPKADIYYMVDRVK